MQVPENRWCVEKGLLRYLFTLSGDRGSIRLLLTICFTDSFTDVSRILRGEGCLSKPSPSEVKWEHQKTKRYMTEMCRVVGKVVLEMRDLGQEPKHIVIAGVVRTMLANTKIKRSGLTQEAMETVIRALGYKA